MKADDRPVYLDYNATTPVDPEVVQAMMPFLTSEFGNPSTAHTSDEEIDRAAETIVGAYRRLSKR